MQPVHNKIQKMATFSRIQKYALVGFGAFSGIALYYLNYSQSSPPIVHNSWTTAYEPPEHSKWDLNWDHREPEALFKPLKNATHSPEAENKINEQIEKYKAKFTRHIFLIRHGQYNLEGKTDQERALTELGKKQAAYTGQRLKELDLPITEIVRSTMTRAQETGSIIIKTLNLSGVPVFDCPLIEEGAPIPPEPGVGHWKPEKYFYQDGARIEAAFRKYFYRAPASQEKDTYTVLVCHANVIRYFVCRALQFPPEAWLRLSLNHASITWISITPNGHVILRQLGDSGHMPVDSISRR
ncbi:serine/threonine-protein phosphatase Pgam5, mitochondrial isoform X2 [Chrysoperla carnea]|uniref:serine/threonine-protein phosphatase Pgam5, mitochondrial isoform X2 n=1 Tax=Chrysoperla carnea TaxID=189513 RepID=UPI001D073EC5|nr:serine/threonine-protein phosphatase Pgam5, mitochondrial isoform X2 [Chrysoperla carnea]